MQETSVKLHFKRPEKSPASIWRGGREREQEEKKKEKEKGKKEWMPMEMRVLKVMLGYKVSSLTLSAGKQS